MNESSFNKFFSIFVSDTMCFTDHNIYLNFLSFFENKLFYEIFFPKKHTFRIILKKTFAYIPKKGFFNSLIRVFLALFFKE